MTEDVAERGVAVLADLVGPGRERRSGDLFMDAFAEVVEVTVLGAVWARPGLDYKTRSLVTVVSDIASGRTPELAPHFRIALDKGWTRDELIEIVLHTSAYVGGPLAREAMLTLREVCTEAGAMSVTDDSARVGEVHVTQGTMDELAARGAAVMADIVVPRPGNPPGKGNPVMTQFTDLVRVSIFGAIWARPGLDYKARTLVCVVSDIVLGCHAELAPHARMALKQGWTREELIEVGLHLCAYVGAPRSRDGLLTLSEVFAEDE